MSPASSGPVRHLHDLVHAYLSGQVQVEQFCEQFERIFNLELDKRELSDVERNAFSALFDKVVWYSPFPEELARIPNYLGDKEIRQAAEEAVRALQPDEVSKSNSSTRMPSAIPSTIFFSGQADIKPGATGRTFIEQALEKAAARLANDVTLGIDPVVDRVTMNLPGSSDIRAAIFHKIDAASAVVADVTIVGKTEGGKPTPNPNVLLELGYALKCHGWKRILLVQNTAFGRPEDLPFDLNEKRVITYHSPSDAQERATERRALESKLEEALRQLFRGGVLPDRSV